MADLAFLDNYEPVEDRLERFWKEHPQGRVVTDLIAYSDSSYIVRSEVFRDHADPVPASSGYAQETVQAKGVNSTSALENCETSAIGRALANLGYAAKGKRPSREEMSKPAPVTTDPDWYEGAEKRLREALSVASLEAVKAEVARRHAAGQVTDSDFVALGAIYQEAFKILAQPSLLDQT